MAVANAVRGAKTVADPNAQYESLIPLWKKSRAVCSGERYVKDFDSYIDIVNFNNLLIPFSPSMSQKQYDFYKAEAELPGITAEFSKMVIGGLLRKKPTIVLPEKFGNDVVEWISEEFNQDNTSILSFLDASLLEELQTGRAWIYVDFPKISNIEELTREEIKKAKPFPILWKAETVINWTTAADKFGKEVLTRVIQRGYDKVFTDNEFHPTFKEIVNVHELDSSGFYQIRVFEGSSDVNQVQVVNGETYINHTNGSKEVFKEVKVITDIMMNGERLTMLPIWPLNGQIEPEEPPLTAIIDKEIALYNKISRRNHLLYGAATYTPVISSDMSDERFEEIINSGLGTWLKLNVGDSATVLETPTAALQDMDRAIVNTIEEMAKLGIRMLSPESAQSGVALQLRNASQTARLSSLNSRISATLQQVIAFMLQWKMNTDVDAKSVKFMLSEDFSTTPLDANYLRLATEWYQQGLIPRSIWLELLKHNDVLPPEYDDEVGKVEIMEDMEAKTKSEQDDFAKRAEIEQGIADEVEKDEKK